MNWLYVASALSFVTLLVHLFGGGPSVAKPLLDSDLGDEAKYTNYYCWHLVSIVIGAMSLCFCLAASDLASIDLAILCACLALLFALWSGVLVLIKKQSFLTLPQWVLFLPIGIAGVLGSL